MFKSVKFEVIGDQRLFCDGCEQRVERLLKTLQGVGQVRAQARNQQIEVLFDIGALDADTIAKHLNDAGYETKLVSADQAGLHNRGVMK
ncbi:MAG: heavy-metal-associated domain-containing protein [Pseudomonadales bacterium]